MWTLVCGVIAIIAAALTALAVFGGQTLPERTGPPVEQLAVERAVLSQGVIEVVVRNTGPDPVQVAQVFVNDAYVDFTGPAEPIGRLASRTLALDYPWITGQPYTVSMLTSTGLVIEHVIPAAVATPVPQPGFFGLMALLGTYVGVIPVLLGMLVLPVLRRTGSGVVRVLLAVTVGLLAFLAVDALLEGLDLAALSGGAFGGPALVLLGAALAFLALTAIDRAGASRVRRETGTRSGMRLALMIAVGIGLHNLGEGLAIGSAYAVGELALGTSLVVGFAAHNTTEGLAIVAPLTDRRPSLAALAGLGVVAGAPAIIGAVIGASVNNAALTAVLLGVGVGAIVQVVVQIAPGLRSRTTGSLLDPAVIGGLGAGVLVMYLTGLLVAA
ncbi:ZIP family metal transporter [Pseudonocardia sp. KRD-184]|uniref:ZIP family metal transporter n=1 Tax=Pseudonocardia oceani TaxID=2792013 RepID=A0ABS6U3T8_9PSEU|nr:ZIP family metal transporter [Pseudonocardia oceani]MBW0098204.1 ZIP family metal transporter [Pseudonocardia oceani]MBW0124807.1 ZIP family metal transporter [Pseudonocardia oceani]MBW0126584.1 ZIP family metal transporter [Pseudonocardia oceani]